MDTAGTAAPLELQIETSVEILAPLDAETELPAVEAAQLSPKVDRIRHHLIPARTTTCVRAPCLKRQVSVPISSMTNEYIASRLEAGHVQDRVASNPLPTSFAAPRNLTLQSQSRHVHFDEAPPEEFFVLSGESYDRRPIKCTQGGSEFDMSLPPRSTSYNGDDSAEDDASSVEDGHVTMQPAEEPAPDVGFFHDSSLKNWACIKNGTVIASVGYQPRQQQSGLMASGKSLHFSALSSSQHASALAGDAKWSMQDTQSPTRAHQPEVSQKVSLPVHGFRSFGGLQNSLAPEITSATASAAEKPSTPSKQEQASPEFTPPALRNFSPDATPMPSPSLHKSIGTYASVGYFGVTSNLPTSTGSPGENNDKPSLNLDAELASDMEVLRDAPAPVSDCRAAEYVLTESSDSHAKSFLPTAITIKMPDVSPQSTPRRLGLERRAGEKDASRVTSLHPPGPGVLGAGALNPGWSSLLNASSSPFSSRCSSVDPWSSLSSDGDGDGTESPGNENSWISSNCTSPDLSPFEQMADSFNHQSGSSSASGPSLSDSLVTKKLGMGATQPTSAPGLADRTPTSTGHDWEDELKTPKGTDFGDETKFSSSVETVNTVSWEHRHGNTASSLNLMSGISSADVSASEATTPDSSRRPSFHHADMFLPRLSPRMRSSFGAQGSALDLDDDDSRVMCVRSLSRDGHAKKKSSKCRFCRSLRSRFKACSAESSAPTSSGGSAQVTDAESETKRMDAQRQAMMSAATSGQRYVSSSAEVSEMEEDDSRSRSSISQLRASVRSLSVDEWSLSSVHPEAADDAVSSHRGRVAPDALHDRESSGSPGESCSDSAQNSAINLAMVCTCEKKREKEKMKKKMRKEREMERERDREWERDQARGRQKKLFGESYGNADDSCLSALDGF